MKLQELITINKRYQDSVNIRLDLQDNEKIMHYIPTSASVRVLVHYLNNIQKNEENATMLIGPYGKGKSHLILVLLKLLWKQNEESNVQIKRLIKRVKKVDGEAAELMSAILKSKKPYLPIVVSYGNEDLNTTYLYALNRALDMAGLQDIAPESAYQKAIDAIFSWKENYTEVYLAFDQKLNELGKVSHSAEQMIEQLKQHNKKAYQLFVKLYPEFTAGSIFHPMVEMHAMKVYEEVNKVLCEDYGYAGIFIVFDEFSKYIEMQDKKKDQLSGNMGVVQEMCELCTRKDNHMHHIFVAHKSIKEYGSHLSRETINCFTGVEGRLKEVHFITSVKNNYELLGNILQKKEDEWNQFVKGWNGMERLTESYHIPAFYTTFSEEEFVSQIVEDCFPLKPVTAYLLLKISEQVGQNERSLFTFLTKKELNTFVWWMRRKDGISCVPAALVYDYFSTLFYKEVTLPYIHEEYRKAQYVIEHLEENEENRQLVKAKRQIVKALALILMIHNSEEMNGDRKVLYAACELPKAVFEQALQELEQEGFLVWRKRLGSYQFKNQIAENIEEELQRIQDGLGKIHLEKECEKISQLRYELPKSYNHNYAMTRYFDYVFMSCEAFLKITSEIVDELFEERFSDGKIIALVLPEEKENIFKEEVKEKVAALNKERIVVLEPRTPLQITDSVRELVALQKYIANIRERGEEEDKLLLEELEWQKEDCLYEIAYRLENVYMPYHGHCTVYHKQAVIEEMKDRKEFNRLLSEICQENYANAPVIRHEMINRRNISTPMKKARTRIVEALLNHEDMEQWKKGTAPEATMFRATLYRTGIYDSSITLDSAIGMVLEEITKFIRAAEGKRIGFSEIYRILQGKGYGIRLGVIPIYLAYRFAELEDLPVVYLQDKEYPMDAVLLNQINQNPLDYELYVEKNSVEKEEYLKQLAKIWDCEPEINELAKEIKEWFQGLSRYAMRGTYPASLMAGRFCHYLLHREMNPREFFYEEIPKWSGAKTYAGYIEEVKKIKAEIDGYLTHLLENIVVDTKTAFCGKDEDSLGALLKDWYQFLKPEVKNRVNDIYETAFLKAVQDIGERDAENISDYTIISRLAKVLTDLYIEDWKEDTLAYYKERLNTMIQYFGNVEEDLSEGKKELSFTAENGTTIHKYFDGEIDGTAEFLQNEMTSVMEEFGESVEVEQKVAVLMKMIEDLVK